MELQPSELSFVEQTHLAKRAKMDSKGNLEWIHCTSNIVERLFSIVRYDYRKRTNPSNSESHIFLNVNKTHWDVKTIESFLKNNWFLSIYFFTMVIWFFHIFQNMAIMAIIYFC